MKLLASALSCIILACSTSAKSQSDQNAFISGFADAVGKGSSIDAFEFEPSISTAEMDALEKLAGCVPSVGEGSRVGLVYLIWACEGSPQFERSVSLKFTGDQNPQLLINPLERNFAPTEASLIASELPNPRSMAWKFAEAVKQGDDATLNGLVPITKEQLALLSTFQNLDFRRTMGNTKQRESLLWDAKEKVLRNATVTTVEFDTDGRPIGLIVASTSKTRIGG